MDKKKGLIGSILSFITYKKKQQVKKFKIPEVQELENGKKDNQSNKKSEKTIDNSKKGIKKPISISEALNSNQKEIPVADDTTISTDISTNIQYIKDRFNAPDNKDIVIRQFTIPGGYKAFLAYMDGMVDRVTINNNILKPILTNEKLGLQDELCQLDYILQSVIETNVAKEITEPNEAIYEVLSGNTLLYVNGCNFYISNETKGYEKRAVSTPQTEGVVKGPQEAFNENLRTNITLVRRIIKNNNLSTEFFKIGEQSQTLVAIMYIKGLINPSIIDEVRRRLNGIKTDFLASAGMLEQFLEESPWTLIPTSLSTERPDRTASHIVEGKVAIFLDGTPFVIVVPISVHSLLHSPEDAALKWQYATVIRFIRILAIVMATLLPGLYVAITNFHQEMIPTDLLIAIAKAKENVPFPTVVEVLLMELSFELIREAGIRIPGIIGNTLGIIGALILGQAAVQANIVSPVLIIVVAITGLSNFAIPNFSLAFGLRLLRFVFIIAGAILGFYGIALLITVTWALIMSIKSFGVNFSSPISPKTRHSFDVFIRWPVWKQEMRPDYINTLNERRQPKISKKWTKENPNYAYDEEDSDD